MARSLRFQVGEFELAFTMHKVDRSKLYGSKEILALDDADQVCDLATLAGDGCTLIGRGGTGLGWLDVDGCWREKSQLTPIDKDGNEIEPVPSSFASSIKLFDTATPEQYLDHNIRLVYTLDHARDAGRGEGETLQGLDESHDELMNQLRRGTIFTFPYSFRGGLEADTAFLLLNEDEHLMLAVGSQADIRMIGMSAQVVPDDDPADDGESADAMDFDMI